MPPAAGVAAAATASTTAANPASPAPFPTPHPPALLRSLPHLFLLTSSPSPTPNPRSAKAGGADPATNAALDTLLRQAKDLGVPKDIVERNLKRATDAKQGDYQVGVRGGEGEGEGKGREGNGKGKGRGGRERGGMWAVELWAVGAKARCKHLGLGCKQC